MLELGQVSLNEHKEILQYALDCCDQILLIGKEFAQAYEELPETIQNVHHFSTNTMLVRALIPMMSKGNYTLVKGSRGLKLEEVLKGLKKHFTISLY
jgi:UDP-N-acetylmuramyl pentapeptide synthase